jgi:drug/metabolite transporter (DMT)-like permease
MITALSVMLLKEKVTYGQWAAVAAAFAGVILIIHPGDGAFEWALLLPLLSALAYAGAVIIERKKSDSGNPSVMALHSQVWMALTGVTLGLLLGFGELNSEMQQHPSMDFLLRGWQWPSARDFTILLICGIVGSASTFFMTKAYTLSKASALAPFEYTALLWSILLGWLVFGHLPEAKEWAGIALLVGAGLVSIYAADTTQAAAPAESTAGDGVSS